MNTARLLVLSLSLISAFLIPVKLQAAEPDLSKPNQNWQCLEAERIGGHNVRLSSKTQNQFPPPGSDVYIVECLSTKQGTKCTTGECKSDEALVGNCNDLTFLKQQYSYSRSKFTGTQPMLSDFEGKIAPIEWQSDLRKAVDHSFFGVGVSAPTTVGEGQWPTLQLGTFYFPNSSESCTAASFRWDPYGRVFDSVSLEPIPGVNVTLLQSLNNVTSPVNLIGLTNPQITEGDGVFNFVVPDGTYFLKPAIASHTFPFSPGKINPAWDRIYSDLYRGEKIIQQGFIQHRDIPLDPLGAPLMTPIKIIDYKIILDKLNSKLIISGSVSHPLSIVKIFSGNVFVKQVTASKFGDFRISIDSASINQALPIRLEAIRNNFAAPPLVQLIRSAYAQEESDSIEIAPIMNNLEGYAFNSSGSNIPLAEVTVMLKASSKPFYTVKADKLGYFNVPSQFLPPLPYYLKIKSPTGEVSNLETMDFAKFNNYFARAASVNYGTYRPQSPDSDTSSAYKTEVDENGKESRTVIGPDGKVAKVDSEGNIVELSEENQIQTEENQPEQYIPSDNLNTQEQPNLPIPKKKSNIFVLLFVLAFIIIAIIFYLAKKNHRRP